MSIICYASFMFFIVLHFASRGSGELFCCYGWEDEKVEARPCQNLCYGIRFCDNYNTSTNCVSNWGCDHSASPGKKTKETCTNLEAGDDCNCKTDYCNCPPALKGKGKEPEPDQFDCCIGADDDIPHIEIATCNELSVCVGYHRTNFTANINYTIWSCHLPEDKRKHKDCFEFSHKTYAGLDGDCACTENYCNCPPNLRRRAQRSRNEAEGNSKFFLSKVEHVFFLLLFLILGLQ